MLAVRKQDDTYIDNNNYKSLKDNMTILGVDRTDVGRQGKIY